MAKALLFFDGLKPFFSKKGKLTFRRFRGKGVYIKVEENQLSSCSLICCIHTGYQAGFRLKI